MAHSFDTKAQIVGATSPLAANYTCGAGATLLVLGIVVAGATARAGGAPTYNGVAMTQCDTVRTATETNCEMWYLSNPPTGSALSVSIPNTGSLNLYCCASSYKAQSGYTSMLDADIGKVQTVANPSLTLTPTIAGDVLVGVLGDGYVDPPTDRTHTTLYETDNGSFSDNHQYALIADTSATAVGWTIGSDDHDFILAAFKEIALTTNFVAVGASKDNYLRQQTTPANWGTEETMQLIEYSTNYRKRPILSFDFAASVPAGATIVGAVLRLWITVLPTGSNHVITCSRIRRGDWSETQSTWNIYKTGSNWTTAGASDATNDYDATAAATSVLPIWAARIAFDVKDQVQTALDSASGIAHFILQDGASVNSITYLASREYTTDELKRPRLEIAYTTAAAGPALLQTINGLAKASLQARNGLALASIKTWNGLA